MKTGKRIFVYGLSASLIFSFFLFSDCAPDCIADKAPFVSVTFRNKGDYSSIKSISPEADIDIGLNTHYFSLPISLHHDQLSYVFSNSTRSDTLTFAYKRNFKFQSTRCGYGVIIENLRLIKPISYRNADVKSFSSSFSPSYGITIYD
jgi:hypothetical protein